MRSRCLVGFLALFGTLAGEAARAINVVIDYRYDTTGFFSTETVSGVQARATVEHAAQFFSNLIIDTLDPITFTDPMTPNLGDYPVWRQTLTHPGTGQNYIISSAQDSNEDGLSKFHGYPVADEFRDIQIPADQWLVYVGGAGLSVTGLGGTGEAHLGQQAFNDMINHRGKNQNGNEFEYSTWGGYAIFDGDGSTNWQYDYTEPVPLGKIDLFSVALHELGHTLGINGNNLEWNLFQDGDEWDGPQALAAWKREDPNAPDDAFGLPTVSTSDHHWENNPPGQPLAPAVRSYVLGTRTLQESSMDPIIAAGTRKLFTNVDALALRDIGWDIDRSGIILPGDLNIDGVVDGLDLAIWDGATQAGNAMGDVDGDGDSDGADLVVIQRETNIGEMATLNSTFATSAVPEPAAAALVAAGLALFAAKRRRG